MSETQLLQRFLRYVEIDTNSQEGAGRYPSTPGQLELGRLLVDELHELGIADARQDEHGILMATVPSTVEHQVPSIALCAHLDTSPETPGAGVKPQVIENYPGGELVLPGDSRQVIRPEEHPGLADLVGRTLITSDGTTLLGADDKAGVAVIIEAVAQLVGDPTIKHGPIRLCFTCDEEIGRGVDHLDLDALGASVCYTLDGQGTDTVDVETFSADLAVITVGGVNIHPSIAKGRMTNAVRAAADFINRLPRATLSPESTEAREGFLHPYEIAGGVGQVSVRILLRDFEADGLARQAKWIGRAAEATLLEFPEATIDVSITPQYRNMAEGLGQEPRAVAYAVDALMRLDRTAKLALIRGGTDGSRLTERGLPCPNLSTGQHMPHSLQEWACLEEMLQAVEWLIALAERWAE